MIADLNAKWFVDYNYDFIDPETQKPIGTLRIPCFLYHDNKAVDSRNILRSAIEHLRETYGIYLIIILKFYLIIIFLRMI